jgi:hypothetical protein
MEVEYKAFSSKQIQELSGYVALWVHVGRWLIFSFLVALTAFPFWVIFKLTVNLLPSVAHSHWWILPTVVMAIILLRRFKKWTGGAEFRDAVRRDIGRGELAITRVKAVDAIRVEEAEDEGPSYFILTDDGEVILFCGQYLDRLQRKGFPWEEFEISEAPESKVFFGLKKVGDKLEPSVTRQPFTYEEAKNYKTFDSDYKLLDVDFDKLKGELAEEAGGNHDDHRD